MSSSPPILSRYLTQATMIAVFAVIGWLVARGGNPADLRASWIAAEFFAQGRLDMIYPHDSGLFLMRPPAEWADAALQGGYAGELFPYIYPPLWAALLSWLIPLTDFASFATVAAILNPLLLSAAVWLAHRAAGAALSLPRWMALSALVLFPTTLGAHALLQQQPQILVAFLILLALERDRSEHPVVAGVALAFAAALKVYPAFYVIFWLAQGKTRAATAFAMTGAALGMASVMLAGWPLHAAFLHELSTISATGLVNGVAYNLDATLAHLLHRTELQPVVSLFAGPVPDGAGGVFVVAKGAIWAAASKLLVLAVLALAALAFYRRRNNLSAQAALWPLAMLCVSFTSPMAFAYHYLAPVVFAPMLVDRLGPRHGLLAMIACVLPTVMVLPLPLPPPPLALFVYQSMGVMAMLMLALGFTACLRPGANQYARHHPASQTP